MIIDKPLVYSMLCSLVISAVAGRILIPILRSLKLKQTEREEGVEAHLAKAGTPTMGGVVFLLALLLTALIFVWRNPTILPVLFLTLACGAIGFVDDYLKVVKHDSDGLLAWQKLGLQLIAALIFFVILRLTGVSMELRLPFASGKMVSVGVLALPLLLFAVLGTLNGVNFTDGLDGLASSVTIIVALFFAMASEYLGAGISPICGAMIGGLAGFLLYNAYPAQVFMGDTGSLALGGFVAGCAYLMQMPLYILIVGLVYLVEVLSVIIQVVYFKATGGKRIFKMSPIHHHFELSGWSETKVVARFSVVTLALCLIGLLAL